MGIGIVNLFKDNTAKPYSYEEYTRKFKKIIGCYIYNLPTNIGLYSGTRYNFNPSKENLVLLITFIERIIESKGYPQQCLNEIKNPELFRRKISEAFRNSVSDQRSVFNSDSYYNFRNNSTVREYIYNYIMPLDNQSSGVNINKINIEKMYSEFEKIWDLA